MFGQALNLDIEVVMLAVAIFVSEIMQGRIRLDTWFTWGEGGALLPQFWRRPV